MIRKPALGALALIGSLFAAGCAASSALVAVPPDAAAIHTAGRARDEFEARRALVRDPELAARISVIGLEALAETPLLAAGDGEAAPLRDGWRFAVLDDPEPEAFLFADRTVFVSRGALAALPGEPALVALFRSAATTFASGAFRPVAAGELVEQPLPLLLPVEIDAGSPAAEGGGRDRWVALLDGLLFGEPTEFGVADGTGLLLPRADVRLALPEDSAFEPAGRGVFRATRSGEPLGLTVREVRGADAATAAPSGSGGDAAGMASHRADLAELGDRLRATAECHGAEVTFVEAFRVRGFSGVRSRLHPLPGDGRTDPAGERVGDGASACGEAPGVGSGFGSRFASGVASGLIAMFRSRGSLVELSLDCARRRFEVCEALFLRVLGSAERRWDAPVPGPMRIGALAAGTGGSVRDALGRLAAEGKIDGPRSAVESLNRGWLDEPVGPEDRVLILSRRRPLPNSEGGAP